MEMVMHCISCSYHPIVNTYFLRDLSFIMSGDVNTPLVEIIEQCLCAWEWLSSKNPNFARKGCKHLLSLREHTVLL